MNAGKRAKRQGGWAGRSFAVERLEDRRLLSATAYFTYHFFNTANPNAVVISDPLLTVADHATVYLHATLTDDRTSDDTFGPPTGTVTLHWYHGGDIGTYPIRTIAAASNPNFLLPVIDIAPATFNEADAGDALPSGPDKGGHLYYITYSGDGNYHPNANTGNALWTAALNETGAFGNINQIVHFEGQAGALGFRQAPTDSAIGAPIDPAVTVAVNKANGTLDTASTAPVTVTLNPLNGATGTLSGTLTANAVSGVATFADLTVDKPGDYTLTASAAGNTSVTSATFTVAKDKLIFSTQPVTTLAKKTMRNVVVTAVDTTGNADPTDTGTVTLAFNPFSGSGKGTLGGTLSRPLVDGVATFDDLVISANGGYRFTATDTNADPAARSVKFSVGPGDGGLALRSRTVKRKNGLVAGDHVFYSLLTTPKKLVDSQTLTITLPEGIIPLHLTGGATVAGNVITCTNPRTRVITFDFLIPEKDILAKAIADDDTLTSVATADYTFTDATTASASATDAVKVGINKEIRGTIRDVLSYPKASLVKAGKPIGGLTVELIDIDNAIVATVLTKGDGSFTAEVPKIGTYEVRFKLPVHVYNSTTKQVDTRPLYLKKFAMLEQGDTRPINLGDVLVPAVFFDTAATSLRRLQTYSTESFQHLKALSFNLFKFDTAAVEQQVTSLLGTEDEPGDPLAPASLVAGGPVSEWVGAFHMLAGLDFVDARFRDSFGFTDKMGLTFAVMVSAKFSEKVGKTLNGIGNKLLPGAPVDAATAFAQKLAAAQQKLNRTYKVATLTAFGLLLNPLLDAAGVPAKDKANINAITFNTLRYCYDLFTGQLLDDLSFESVFNFARVAFDVSFLSQLTGAHVDELPTLFAPIRALDTGLLGGSSYDLQGQVNALAAQTTSYDTAPDPGKSFAILDQVGGYLTTVAKKASVLLGGVNNLYSISRGISGVNEIINGVTKYNPAVTLSARQQFFRQVGTAYGSVLNKVGAGGAKGLEARLLALYFAEGAGEVLRQSLYGATTADMVRQAAFPIFYDPRNTAALARPAATTATATPDATAYLADLAQLAKLVKAGDEPAVTAIYPQWTAHDDALFADLTDLNDRLTAAAPQLNARDTNVADQFTAALRDALTQTYLAQYQTAVWSVSPATGQPSVDVAQLNAAIAAVRAVAKLAPRAQALLVGRSLAATLVTDASTIPAQVAVGATADFTVTVTNVGDQSSTAGTVTLTAGDATLQVTSAAQQALPVLAPGETATLVWQATGIAPSTNAGYTDIDVGVAVEGLSILNAFQTTVG